MRRIKESVLQDLCYAYFLNKHRLKNSDWRSLEDRIGRLPARQRPLISILTPVYNTPENLLIEMVESVRRQIYARWELCLIDDKSSAPHIRPLLQNLAKQDKRIRVRFRRRKGHICRATNDALKLARGEFTALLDHDDVLTADALAQVSLALSRHPDADMIYSDQDSLDMNGCRSSPYFKPDWSPDMFLSTMYVGHLLVFRTLLARGLGGFRPGFEGSQDYDLVLRLTEKTNPGKIVHIPKVLYSRRMAPGSTAYPYVNAAARRTLREVLVRRGIEGTVERGFAPWLFRIRRKIKGNPRVSILIPFRDRSKLLSRCLSSIRERTSYKNYEIILIDNGSIQEETLQLLEREGKNVHVRILRIDEPFNYSRLNNQAAKEATGEHLLLLNNDTEVMEPEWLNAMLEHSQRPEVGAVGAKLLYGSGLIQHAGVVVGAGNGRVAANAHRGFSDSPRDDPGSPHAIRNFSAVTGACMMTRKAVFMELGGLEEKALPVGFNDVDYCLRLREKGYLIVYTPYARLTHHESASRGLIPDPRWGAYMRRRWAKVLKDPYYNPNLNLETAGFTLRL